MRVRTHWGQSAVLRSERFCTAAIAGTGGGKTVVGMVWLIMQMVRKPGMVWLVAEPNAKMVDRVLVTGAQGRMSLIEFLGRWDPGMVFLRSKGLIRHKYGTVVLASAENPDGWQGAHLGGAWLDEAGLMSLEAWLVALQRVSYSDGVILITTTPYNLGWLKSEVYDRGMDGDSDYEIINFPSSANPRYSAKALERAKRSMSRARFEMLYGGKFSRPEGMVYDCFDDKVHVVAPFDVPRAWPRWGGLDFGFNNPTGGVFLARDPDGVYYWYAEHYRREATTGEHLVDLDAVGSKGFRWHGDPSGAQQIAEFRRRGLNVVKGENDVRMGIDLVYELMKLGRLKVFRTCKHGRDELAGYVYKADGVGGFTDEPVKERDHLMDALRYAVVGAEARQRLSLH